MNTCLRGDATAAANHVEKQLPGHIVFIIWSHSMTKLEVGPGIIPIS